MRALRHPARRAPAPPRRHNVAAQSVRPVVAPRARPTVSAAADELDGLDDDELADMLGQELDDATADALKSQIRKRQDAKRASIDARYGPGVSIELAERVDPFDVWLWFEFVGTATEADTDLLDGVLTAWFLLGRLGAFNSSNLQLSEGEGLATRSYNAARLPSASTSVMHDCGELERRGRWARVHVNMGTADELALDALANALGTLARENTPSLVRVVIGGAPAEGWEPPVREVPGAGVKDGPLPGDY